jgi:hypothetical protein
MIGAHYTDKKENKIFLILYIYKGIQMGSGAKEGLPNI